MAKKTDPKGAPSTKKKAKPTKKTTQVSGKKTEADSTTTATEEKEGYTSYGAIEDPEAAAAVTQSVIENAIFTQHFKYALPFTYISVLPQKIIFNALVKSQVIEESENFNKLMSVMTVLKHHEIYTVGSKIVDSTRYEALIPDSSKSLSVVSVEDQLLTYIEVSIDAGEQSALDDKFGFSPIDASKTSSVKRSPAKAAMVISSGDDPGGAKLAKAGSTTSWLIGQVLGNIIAANVSIVEPPPDSRISYIFNKIKNDKLTDQNTQILTDLSLAVRNK